MKCNINSATQSDHIWRIKVTVMDADPQYSFLLEVCDKYFPGGEMLFEEAHDIVSMALSEVEVSDECVVRCGNKCGQYPEKPKVSLA